MEERWGATWQRMIEDVLTGMRDWRTAHPKATFVEIEAAVDERVSRVRARMLEEAALASRSTDLAEPDAEERPCCPGCSGRMVVRGLRERSLRVEGEQEVRLRRSYLTCSACGTGLFPPG